MHFQMLQDKFDEQTLMLRMEKKAHGDVLVRTLQSLFLSFVPISHYSGADIGLRSSSCRTSIDRSRSAFAFISLFREMWKNARKNMKSK